MLPFQNHPATALHVDQPTPAPRARQPLGHIKQSQHRALIRNWELCAHPPTRRGDNFRRRGAARVQHERIAFDPARRDSGSDDWNGVACGGGVRWSLARRVMCRMVGCCKGWGRVVVSNSEVLPRRWRRDYNKIDSPASAKGGVVGEEVRALS